MVLSAEIVKVPDRVQQTRFAAQFSLAQALYPPMGEDERGNQPGEPLLPKRTAIIVRARQVKMPLGFWNMYWPAQSPTYRAVEAALRLPLAHRAGTTNRLIDKGVTGRDCWRRVLVATDAAHTFRSAASQRSMPGRRRTVLR